MIRAAGICFITPDRRALFLKRSREGDHSGEWCFPGGAIEDEEDARSAALREAEEETSCGILLGGLGHAYRTTSGAVDFTTFRCDIDDEFQPILNEEHTAYRWAPLDDPPKPLHPGVKAVLLAMAMEGAADVLAFDRSPGLVLGRPSIGRVGLAFDRESVRTKTANGHLNVAVSNISKAAINPYLGREIPGYEQLGLKPDKIYRLLRAPDELEKAAPTFNDLPLLSRHVAVTADAHPSELVLGSTGSSAKYEHPYLRNGLAIWSKGGIDAVESDAQKELSSAYRYRADMTPGVYDGEAYDGVMRDIVGNHVALVKEGRAGSDVVVGDSSNEEIRAMTKKVLVSRVALMALGAMNIATAPLLAMDQKMPDFLPTVAGVRSLKDFKAKKPDVITAYRAAMKDVKLAQDADIDDVVKIIECLDTPGTGGAKDDLDATPAAAVGLDPEDEVDDALASIRAYLKQAGVSDEIIAALPALGAAAAATDAEPPAFVKKGEKGEKDEDKDKDKKVDKPAMDAAVKAAVEPAVKAAVEAEGKRQQGIRDAERHVRPWAGELTMAFDSGEQVYRHVLKALGVKGHDTVHGSALPTILDMQPKPGAKPPRERLAQDAALANGWSKDFPGADRLRVL